MPFLTVCAIDPGPGVACPVESIQYYQNFWDSGLTLAQTSELIAAVIGIWAVAWVILQIRRQL